MSANTTDVYSEDVYSGNLRPEYSDELDLRPYMLVVLRWWREILIIPILVGGITAVALTLINQSRTPMYSASADILMARLLTDIELDDRVSTSLNMGQADVNGWRASVLQLATSSGVAEAVVAELDNELPAALRSPNALVDVIDPMIPLSPDERYSSNLIRITATTETPELSAMIASSWATHFVNYINGLYGEVPETTILNVTAERDQALAEYQAAQSEYETFVATSQIDALTRQIQEKTTLRDGIMTNFTTLQTAVVGAEYTAGINLYNALANASSQHATALILAQSAGTIQSLDRLYSLHASVLAQLNQARMMERTLQVGGDAAAKSNIAALQLLKLSTFATLYGSDLLTTNLTFTGSTLAVDMTLEEQITDVQALATSLEDYVAELERDIETLATSDMIGANLDALAGFESQDAPTSDTNAGGTTDADAVANPVANPVANSRDAYTQLLGADGILDQAPDAIQAMVTDAHDQLLATLDADIRDLQGRMAAEEAQQRQLIHRRDLAWTTYETVGTKLQELKLLRSSANSELRVGDFATVPGRPEPQGSPVIPVVALTLAAFLGAVALALLVDSLGGVPFFARRTSRASIA